MLQNETPNIKKPHRKIWISIIIIFLGFLFLCSGIIIAIKASSSLQEKQYLGKPTPIPDQMYIKLRTAALQRTAADLDIKVNPNANTPYGIIMDWNIGPATSTLVSFATGDASLYYSSGGGWLGGFGIEKVNNASKHFVDIANEYVDKLSIVSEYPLPPVGYMKFYIITPQGVYGSGDIDNDTLKSNGIDFSSLNNAAQDLIHEISLVPQK